MVDAKGSKLKRLRREADEARINLLSFIWRAISFPGALREKLERDGKWKRDSRRSVVAESSPQEGAITCNLLDSQDLPEFCFKV
jgi:exonuclease I